MNRHEGNESLPKTAPRTVSYPLDLAPADQYEVADTLMTSLTELERHATPDAHVQDIAHVRLIEPEKLLIQGDVAPPIHYCDIKHASFANDTSKTQIKVSGRTLTLESSAERPLNDWRVSRGDSNDEMLSHLDLLDFFQERLKDQDPNFIPQEFQDKPPTDDKAMINHLLTRFQSLSDDYTDARYYKAEDYMIGGVPGVENSDYLNEVGAALSVIHTKDFTHYSSRISHTAETDNGHITEDYSYKVVTANDKTKPNTASGQLSLSSASMSATALNRMARANLTRSDIPQALRRTVALVAQQHFNPDDDFVF